MRDYTRKHNVILLIVMQYSVRNLDLSLNFQEKIKNFNKDEDETYNITLE